jgi:hypothetical protein
LLRYEKGTFFTRPISATILIVAPVILSFFFSFMPKLQRKKPDWGESI